MSTDTPERSEPKGAEKAAEALPGSGLCWLSPSDAAAGVYGLGASGRGFLGCDPVTDNVALIERRLRSTDAIVCRCDGGLLGLQTTRASRWARYVSCEAEAVGTTSTFLALAASRLRLESVWTTVAVDAPSAPMLEQVGFVLAGCLREHALRSGERVDLSVYVMRFRNPELDDD